jgi:hypothetical protein
MLKKFIVTLFLLSNAVAAQAQESGSSVPWRENITMLAVPREPQTVQVALDISRHYPVLLVCYQPMQKEPVLHAWNGDGWVAVSPEEYVNGTFFTTPPQQAVIVESELRPAPGILVPDGTWCKEGYRLRSTDRRVLIHLLGRHFNFPYRNWSRFAKRYEYKIEEINPSLTNVFWWHYRGDEVLPALKARDFEADMDFWQPLEITAAEPVEPVDLKAPEPVMPAEEPAGSAAKPAASSASVEEIAKTLGEADPPADAPVQEMDPFSTNDVPAAVLVPLPTE